MYKQKIYIYPDVRKSTNDYIVHFHESFKRRGYTLNNRMPRLRLLNILFNLDSDVFIFHWIDVIPYLRCGSGQVIFFKICVYLLSLMNKDIVWVMHNKTSHDKAGTQKKKSVEELMDFMAKYSTKILVHAQDGVVFYEEKYGEKYPNKVFFIPHPVYSNNISRPESYPGKFEWNYIIWGTISRYKRILEFLEFAKNDEFFKKKRILVCGKCVDKDYEKQIIDLSGNSITFINKFISDSELEQYMSKSENILFSHNPESVLSSGALIHSLNFGKPILAPFVGNFKEFPKIVYCYHEYKEIKEFNYPLEFDAVLLADYMEQNLWNKFPDRLLNSLSE